MFHYFAGPSRYQEDSDSDSDDNRNGNPAHFLRNRQALLFEHPSPSIENPRRKRQRTNAEIGFGSQGNMNRGLSHLEQNRRGLFREMNHVDRKATFNKIPHTWLGNGTLLRLRDPTHSGNYVIFQRVWKREMPLLISDISKKLNMKLWNPRTFVEDFGEDRNDFVNCMTEELIIDQPMQIFWDGFENTFNRPRDEDGTTMLLKMKEWPRGTSFQAVMPFHMQDLLDALPLSAYTNPHGLLNFVNYLPDNFLTEELGTELLCAYGTTDYPSIGTKKLNVNIADMVNALVYVAKAREDEDLYSGETNKVLQAIRLAGCDNRQFERVRRFGEIAGAIWHVYNAQDVGKINDFLNKVSMERGMIPLPHRDPVQGEKWYLDNILRERLRREYRVECHSILQCFGDVMFIPAGAPYQVRNLRSCIMVKHDFISLQNIKKF